MVTMNELYGDGSDHEVCPRCGFCKVCGDCDDYGCSWDNECTNVTKEERDGTRNDDGEVRRATE